MIKKRCSKCKKKKPLDDFFFIRHGKYRMSECKKCFCQRSNVYYYENKDKCLELKRQWVEKNRKRFNKVHLEYQKRNSKKINLNSSITYWKKKTGIKLEKFKYGTATVSQLRKRLKSLKDHGSTTSSISL
jgi:hypothetical protein